MAGIFRYNPCSSTPSRRSTLSPFCTSPGQLQDVTMDNSNVLGYRSPIPHAGTSSPGQGRSIREFEEQMASLRKENFNLKLRIYFLEEKIPGYSSSNPDGHESIMKQNIELKVEMEILRKELQEKQSLLGEAAKALELMEQSQKETEEKSQGIIDDLYQKIQYLEMENKELEKCTAANQIEQIMGRTDITGDVEAMRKVRELEGCVKNFEQQIEELSGQINKLETLVTEKNEKINELEDTIKQLKFQNAELAEQLENKNKEIANAEYPKLKEELYDHKKQLADKLCLLDEIESKLKEKTSAHEKLCKVIQQLMLNTRNLEMENSRLKDLSTGQNGSQLKEDFYSNQSTGMSKTTNDPDAVIEIAILKSKLDKLTEEKNAEVNKLKLEIKKKTANLQNLVNTELWEKNREIERLTKLINKSNNSLPCSPVHEIDQLQLSFTDTEYYQALKRNKHLQEKIDTLIQKLVNVSDRNADPIIQQLKSEINEAREEADKANRWRKDCAEFCAILTSRLEELAGFLDSLLKQKDVLGALAADRRRAMRKAVDKSLDLSRSLNNNMTLSISGISLAEHSLAQLSNISGLLDSSLENKENKASLKDQTELIENLKTEVKTLKKELDRKRLTEYCKKERRSLPPLILDNQSESEAWSEPDRNVSLQRIGLENSVCANQNKKEENALTSSESGTDTNRKSKSKAHEKINQLEHIISQHENRILEAHCELLKNDDKLKEENQRFMEINQELEEYKKVNGMLEIEIANYKSHFDKIFAEQENLKRNIEEKTSVISKITEERDQLHIEVRVSEMKIDTLKTDIEEIKTKHQKELANIEEREREKLNNLQKEFLLKLEQKLKEQEEIQREQINREARHIYEEDKRKLDETNKQLVEAQNTIDYLRENEVELSNSLIDKEKSMRNLKKNLDESTLQASKAVIERTKVVKEKLLLENKIQELITKLTVLEEEKSNLNMKMSQLENMNSLLQKKILNNSKNNYTTTKHMSDGSHSGYTSEEVPLPTRGATQRLENSSPDLGIESDAGRTSSVELSSAQAPMLKTIEIKGSIKEDAEGDKKLQSNEVDNNPVDEENNPQLCITSHDCAKVELENKELRRKLNRTKRAFEDTYRKLQEANQRKEQIERDIKHQILKTQNVLKNVRTNMESELEHNKKD